MPNCDSIPTTSAAAQSQPPIENQMIVPYADNGAATCSPPTPLQSIPVGAVVINHVNKKSGRRRRPKKRAADGPLNPVGGGQPQTSSPMGQGPVQTEIHPPVFGSGSPFARGTTSGSNEHKEALGSRFTPHIVNVNPGEEIFSKIMAIAQNGQRAICILSGNGAISSVTLRQPATSGGTATYEGRFEILSLAGSFIPTNTSGHVSRTGGLNITMAGPDGRVVGGCLAGLLVAASPVEVVVGSFLPEGHQEE